MMKQNKKQKKNCYTRFYFSKKEIPVSPLRRHNQPDASFVFIKRRNRRLMKQHPFSGFFSRASRVEKKHANNSAKDNLTFVKYIQNVSLSRKSYQLPRRNADHDCVMGHWHSFSQSSLSSVGFNTSQFIFRPSAVLTTIAESKKQMMLASLL